jgi:hypothetical protein
MSDRLARAASFRPLRSESRLFLAAESSGNFAQQFVLLFPAGLNCPRVDSLKMVAVVAICKKPRRLFPGVGFLFWRRPIDSLTPVRSPAALAGLTVYPPASQHCVFSARVGVPKSKNPTEMNPVGFLVLATSYSRTAYRRTTIGAAAFHCRVRNGNGWGHRAIVTREES